jgi:hypothetical protein
MKKRIYVHYIDDFNVFNRMKIESFAFGEQYFSPEIIDFLQNTPDKFTPLIRTFNFETEDTVNDSLILEKIEDKLTFPNEKIIVYIDMDDTIVQYTKQKEQMLKDCPEMAFPQANYGFFTSMTPFDDAVDVIKKMIAHPMIEVGIATAPSIRNPMSYTEKRVCIEDLFGLDFCENLVIISKKNRLDGKNVYLVDDRNSGNGQDLFIKGKHIHYGSEDFPNWKVVGEYFFNMFK